MTVLQTIFIEDPADIRIDRFVIFSLWGGAYNIVRYAEETSEDGDGWEWEHARKTILIGVIAGALMALTDAEMTSGAFEHAMIMAVPIANEASGAFDKFRQRIFEYRFLTEHNGWTPPERVDEPSDTPDAPQLPEESPTDERANTEPHEPVTDEPAIDPVAEDEIDGADDNDDDVERPRERRIDPEA